MGAKGSKGTPNNIKIGEDCVMEINSRAEWEAVADMPTAYITTRCETVKFVVDLGSNEKTRSYESPEALYFLNTRRHPMHFSFCEWSLHYKGGLGVFNKDNYSETPNRRFILGQILFFPDLDKFAFELMRADNLPIVRLIGVRDGIVARSTYLSGATLHFHPISDLHDQTVASLPPGCELPLLTGDLIYGGLVYQPLTLGRAMGTLVPLTGELEEYSGPPLTYKHIVVAAEVPLDLPVVAGLITAKFQAPLSHVAILSSGRNTINMGLRDALEHEKIKPFLGKLVEVSLAANDFTVKEVTEAEAETFWTKRNKKRRVTVPPVHAECLDDFSLVPLSDPRLQVPKRMADILDHPMLGVVGTKAYQLALIQQVQSFFAVAIPGVTLPMSVYNSHVSQEPLATALRDLFELDVDDVNHAAPFLTKVRDLICELDIPNSSALLDALSNTLREWGVGSISGRPSSSSPSVLSVEKDTGEGSTKETDTSVMSATEQPSAVPPTSQGNSEGGLQSSSSNAVAGTKRAKLIFRSSTNCEDLPGFSGAGLHDSLTLEASEDGTFEAASVLATIKKVWASLWNFRAYSERKSYMIHPTVVSMAVLVQPFYGDVVAKGVAVTANPYRHDYPGILLNIVPGHAQAVTDNDGNNRPEQLLAFGPGIQVIFRSSYQDEAILGDATLKMVIHELRGLHEKFVSVFGLVLNTINALDVEFLVSKEANGDLRTILLQARPCIVRHRDLYTE